MVAQVELSLTAASAGASGLEDMLTYPPVPGKRTENCHDRRSTRDGRTDALPAVSGLMSMPAIKDGLTGRPTRT